MGYNENVTYDPTDVQLKEIKMLLGNEDISLEDLVKRPEAIRMLLVQQAAQIYDLRSTKSELSDLRKAKEDLRDEREQLRIQLAELREHDKGSLLEIPVSMLSGFAINMLTSSSFKDGVGWMLFILSLVFLLYLRRDQVNLLVERIRPTRRSDE